MASRSGVSTGHRRRSPTSRSFSRLRLRPSVFLPIVPASVPPRGSCDKTSGGCVRMGGRQRQQNKQYQQPAQIRPQHHQSQLGHQQAIASGNTTQFPHGNGPLGANRASYATDYQPMNNLLGNLHLMRQQRRQNNAQSSQMQTQIRQLSPVIPMQQPHQQQHQHQHQQNHYQRQYGNYHSVSKPATSNNGSGKNRSQKKKVSLRVSSNLF